MSRFLYVLLCVLCMSECAYEWIRMQPPEVFCKKCVLKDTHRENAPSNKTPALTKSMNMDICVVGISNQLFIRGS